MVVRKGYEYPEIVPKILSVMFDYMRYSYDDPRGEFQQYYTGNIDPTARPLAINLDYNQALTICYENLQAALNGKNRRMSWRFWKDRSKRYAAPIWRTRKQRVRRSGARIYPVSKPARF